MFKAFVLVRNLKSRADRLDFDEFTINRVGLRFKKLKEVFRSFEFDETDWFCEKSYTQLPPGPPSSVVGGIPKDIEDILLLLRLYRAGDVSFIKHAIILPSGNTDIQLPNRAMNDLNSHSSLRFEVESEECQLWKAFADSIRRSRSWNSDWFVAARRFFLSGGAKPFNPKSDDVDRMVDYATSLESALLPEKDYNTRRVSRRAAALIATEDDPVQKEVVAKFIRTFYEIRSRIVHGSGLGDKNRQWLSENSRQVEDRIRQILATAVQKLPSGEEDRRVALAELYDLTDEDRGNFAFEKFRDIRTTEVRKAIAAKISALTGE
jgi:hypothetical protein